MTDSLCCTPDIDATFLSQPFSNKIKFKRKKMFKEGTVSGSHVSVGPGMIQELDRKRLDQK